MRQRPADKNHCLNIADMQMWFYTNVLRRLYYFTFEGIKPMMDQATSYFLLIPSIKWHNAFKQSREKQTLMKQLIIFRLLKLGFISAKMIIVLKKKKLMQFYVLVPESD